MSPQEDSPCARPAVTVVVPFHGDEADAAKTARGLDRLQLGTPDEVIVADNTSDGVFAAPAASRVRVVRAPLERSPYHARNVGAEHAANAWLLFLDADCRPAATLLDDFFSEPVDAACGVVAGRVTAAPAQPGLVPAYARSRHHLSEAYHVASERPSAIGGNMLVRTAAWRAVGGFQEGVRSGADLEICWRLQDAGWALAYRRGAVVEHSHVRTLGAMVRQAGRHAGGRAWLNRRYRGAFPRPELARPLTRCGAGVVVWTLVGRPRRALFKAIDAVWIVADFCGYLTGNAAERSVEERPWEHADVLVLNDLFPALSETFVATEALALEAAGHRVRVIASARPKRPETIAVRALPAAYLEDDGVARKLRDLAWIACRHPARCLRDLAERRRWRREEPVWPLRSLAPLARKLSHGDETHIHAHFASTAALHALRLGRLLGRPFSVTAHAYDIYREPRNLREKLERATFATSGCDYTVRDLQRVVSSRQAPRIHKIIMGVDGQRFHRSSRYPGGRSVLAVGRLVEKKGFVHLIEAAALLHESKPLDRVLIVGDGPLRASLHRAVAEHGLTGVVELLGWRGPETVRGLLEEADVLVMPCVVAADGDRDSMPVVVKEALAMEVPVVASDEVGLPEVVKPPWGTLVPPGDSRALAEAIGALLELPADEREAMGQAGRSWVLANCDVAREAARLSALIESCRTAARPRGSHRPARSLTAFERTRSNADSRSI